MKVRSISARNVKEDIHQFDNSPTGIYKIKDSLGLFYHENSKFDLLTSRKSGVRIASFSNPYIVARSIQPYKAYPGKPTISFEQYADNPPPKFDFFSTISSRESTRDFVKYAISLNELYYLIHYSYGISRKKKIDSIGGHQSYRMIPSPGALYPLEVYIVLFSSDLTAGLYHYRPDLNCIELIKEGMFKDEVVSLTGTDAFIDSTHACGFVLTTSVFERTFHKYGERGYRWILQEVGFVNQNLSLVAQALGLGSCMLGGFMDDELNRFLGIDHPGETVQSAMIIGKGASDE